MAVLSKLARYRDISTLGSGGMATVVLAQDTLLGRQVALKRMHTAADPRGTSRLRREALVGASISHPNLVSIYDVVTPDEGDVVIVMEYIDGENLRDRMRREGPLPVADTLRILEGVAAGLDAIHAQGIVHRDVKPANILLGARGTVKLADLGIAAAPDRTRITTVGTVLGSFSYMAPEQLEDAPVTPALDIYALAAVAYEALSGVPARRESTPIAVAHAIATAPPPDLRKVWSKAPAAAAELLVRAMARDPAQRPRSAGEFVGRLRAALEPQDTRRVTPPPSRRRRASLAAAGAAAGGAAAAGAAANGVAAGGGARRDAAGAAAPAQGAGAAGQNPVQSARRRQTPPPAAAPPGARRTARAVVPLALLLAAGVVAAILLGSGGPRSRGPTTSVSHTTAAKHRATTTSHSASGATAPRASSTPTTSTPATSAPVTPSASRTSPSSSPTSPSPRPTTSSSSSASTAPTGGSGSPTAAVSAFYELAASHRYAQAWALADPVFRNQLGGYRSFQYGQAGDKQIIFHTNRVISQTGHSATVQVRTTSIRTNGTQQCQGTVQLQNASSSRWLLHAISINCS